MPSSVPLAHVPSVQVQVVLSSKASEQLQRFSALVQSPVRPACELSLEPHQLSATAEQYKTLIVAGKSAS